MESIIFKKIVFLKMGRIDLQLMCNLENLDQLHMKEDCEWYFRTKCASCGEIHDTPIYFVLSQIQDMENSRGKANYVAKCKMCERTGSVEYQINTCKPYLAA